MFIKTRHLLNNEINEIIKPERKTKHLCTHVHVYIAMYMYIAICACTDSYVHIHTM